MKFGYLKTAIERKLVNSFVNESLTNDLKTFKQLVLKSTPTKKLFFIYDKLNENLGMDKESASLLVDEIIKESKGIISITSYSRYSFSLAFFKGKPL